jgi:hypothetical protein
MLVKLLHNYIRLILRYRQESFSDMTNTYPAKSMPTVPSVFRTTLNAVIPSPFSIPMMLFPEKRKRTALERQIGKDSYTIHGR